MKLAHKILIPLSAAVLLVPNLLSATILSEGHVDGIGIGYENNAWDLHIHDEDNDFEYETEEAVLRVLEQAETAVPTDTNFAFLGSEGSPVWVLPGDASSAESLGVLFLGIAAEEVDGDEFDSDVRVTLSGLNFTPEADGEESGHFALYRLDGFGVPTVLMNSNEEGIGADDFVEIPAGAHEDFNWAFTRPGFYELTFVASGTAGVLTKTGTAAYRFRVRSDGAPYTAANTPGNHAVSGSVFGFTSLSTPDINDAGDLVYVARLSGDGASPANDAAVVFEKAGVRGFRARKGDVAPGLEPAVYRTFGEPVLSASGTHELVSFAAALKSGSGGVTGANDSILQSEFVNGAAAVTPHVAWREGDPAPGLSGYKFHALSWFIAADDGTLFFASSAKRGNTTKRGVWVRKVVAGEPQTVLLVATGETFLTDMGPKKVGRITPPIRTSRALNQARGASTTGRLALRVAFTDGTTQIITFQP